MPLAMIDIGNSAIIKACTVKNATRRYLESLGIVSGSIITVISKIDGNIILNVKGTRIAINRGIAQMLIVEEFKPCSRHKHRRRFRGGGERLCRKH